MMIPCPRCNGTGQGGLAFVSSRTGHFTTETACNICPYTGDTQRLIDSIRAYQEKTNATP